MQDWAKDLNKFDHLRSFLIFIGYPRSGHSLIGSILDAHPHMVIAHEYNLLENLIDHKVLDRKKKILQAIYKNTEAYAGQRIQTNYNYTIPNQYQGRYLQRIHVIGDKKGGKTTGLFIKAPDTCKSALGNFLEDLGLPLKIIHVLRNPFDNIATIAIRENTVAENDYSKMNISANNPLVVPSLDKHIHAYTHLIEENANFHRYDLGEIYHIYSEDVLSNPRDEIKKLVNFLGESVSPHYLDDCCRIVMKKPSNTRNYVKWSESNVRTVANLINDLPILHRYQSKDPFHFLH